MPARPDLLDNLTRTHADGLGALVHDHDQRHGLSVASGYVNLGGLEHLAVTVTDGRGVRVLLGAAPDPGLGAEVPLSRFELALANLSGERDLARFPPSRAADRLAAVEAWLRLPHVHVKRYLTRFLHGKAYLFGDADDPRAALVTSANLTGAGMHRNLELGLVRYDPGPAGQAIAWFDGLWDAAEDFKDDLLDLLFPDPGLLDPQTVYLRALLELYGDELDQTTAPATPVGVVSLAPFQRDGYERARRILAEHHGVVYADGVGTGKTEIGLAFVEEYALRRGQRALVITPKQLHRNWTDRLAQARLPAEVLSFQQVATDEQLAPDAAASRRHLANDRDTYRLVVVDEAHALRNPDTTWYRAMARLLGGERKDLVLLTATVNNGLWDLYHLVMLFARHDRALAQRGITSLRDVFLRAGANERDPENLDPDAPCSPSPTPTASAATAASSSSTTRTRTSPTARPCASLNRTSPLRATTLTRPTLTLLSA